MPCRRAAYASRQRRLLLSLLGEVRSEVQFNDLSEALMPGQELEELDLSDAPSDLAPMLRPPHQQQQHASRYRGLVRPKPASVAHKWQAQITHRGTCYFVGIRESEEAADRCPSRVPTSSNGSL